MLTDSTHKGGEYKSLEMSAQTNMLFKDIDINKSLELLNKPFTVQPPSMVLMLRDVINIEEVG
jgi:hypothetical protein